MVVYNNGSIFEGYYKENYKDGPGRYIWPNGDYYIGEFKKSKKHGNGEIHYFNGDVFIGEFHEDEMHGIGKWQYAAKGFNEESDEDSDKDSDKDQKQKIVYIEYNYGKKVKEVKQRKESETNKKIGSQNKH